MDDQALLLFETPLWRIVLAEDQQYLGRCTIILKRACGDLAELTEDEQKDFFAIVKRLEALVRTTFGARMFNWSCLMNNAYLEASPKPQVHWQMRPRYARAVTVVEEVFEDPNFGYHYLRDPKLKDSEQGRRVSPKLLAHIKAALVAHIA